MRSRRAVRSVGARSGARYQRSPATHVRAYGPLRGDQALRVLAPPVAVPGLKLLKAPVVAGHHATAVFRATTASHRPLVQRGEGCVVNRDLIAARQGVGVRRARRRHRATPLGRRSGCRNVRGNRRAQGVGRRSLHWSRRSRQLRRPERADDGVRRRYDVPAEVNNDVADVEVGGGEQATALDR